MSFHGKVSGNITNSLEMYLIVNLDSPCMVYTSVRKNLCAASPRQGCRETPKKTELFVGMLELPGILLRWTIWVWIRPFLTPIKVTPHQHHTPWMCLFVVFISYPAALGNFFLLVWVNMSFPSSHSIPTLVAPSPPLWVLYCSKKKEHQNHFILDGHPPLWVLHTLYLVSN